MQMSGLVGGAWLSLEWHMAFSYPIVNEEEQVPVLQSGTRLKQTGQKWKNNMYIKSGKKDCLVPHLNQSLSWQQPSVLISVSLLYDTIHIRGVVMTRDSMCKLAVFQALE
jgi:hypothetical protein